MSRIGLLAPSLLATMAGSAAGQIAFVDGTDAAGLGGLTSPRVCLADVNGDGRPDAIIRDRPDVAAPPGTPDRYRVFLNHPPAPAQQNRERERAADDRPSGDAPPGSATATPARPPSFLELSTPTGLPTPRDGDCLVFADLDNDGALDAIFTRSLDINSEKYTAPPPPERTCWLKGNGDGTFGSPLGAFQIIDAAKPATTACIAVGDADRDGLLDLFIGNWYTKYGDSNEAFTNDLLYRRREAPSGGMAGFVRRPLPQDDAAFDEEQDAAGRPTYGAMFASLDSSLGPAILELNYGRRANRVLRFSNHGGASPASWDDFAPQYGLDGDANRSGKYPAWLKERAKTDSRFDREDEKPYRSHGNTFDAAIGDIDNDGDFDLFFAAITHAWAGDSSDRSAFHVNHADRGTLTFDSPPELSVDRIPPMPPEEDWIKPPLGSPEKPWYPRWNQGDLFCELADLDQDGRLDLILSSGDYPDPAPCDQRIRIFRQTPAAPLTGIQNVRLELGGAPISLVPDFGYQDVTASSGIDHAGGQQISIGDVDGDGDLDILAGQAFNRFSAEDIKSRGLGDAEGKPRVHLYLNQAADRRAAAGKPPNALALKLVGDPAQGVSRDALGAIVRVTADLDGPGPNPPVTMSRQLVGIGGHAGKQNEFLVQFGLGEAGGADTVEVFWPARERTATTLRDVPAGRRTIRQNEKNP